jgi:hypothetical protein
MRVMNLSWRTFAIVAVLAAACGSSSNPGGTGTAGSSGGSATGKGGSTGAAGSSGTSGNAGTTGHGGTTGNAGRGGTTGNAGTTGTGGSGSQPIGAACANTSNCSQADGTAVCCLSISTCVLDTQCPGSPNYVSCETTPCAKSGWVCCNAGGMHFCTKQSACP